MAATDAALYRFLAERVKEQIVMVLKAALAEIPDRYNIARPPAAWICKNACELHVTPAAHKRVAHVVVLNLCAMQCL